MRRLIFLGQVPSILKPTLYGTTFSLFNELGPIVEISMSSILELEHVTVHKDHNGRVEGISVQEGISLRTSVGTLIPAHTPEDEGRKRLAPMKLYKNGAIRCLPLEESTLIKTPIGMYSAEMVTFYESGALKRFFPLNGRVSAYWTEKNEMGHAVLTPFHTPLGEVLIKPLYVQFYENGNLQSMAMCPDCSIKLSTPFGEMLVRKGFSFDAQGHLNSFEPHEPVEIQTPIGPVQAYDSEPKGMSAETNSLIFTPEGRVESITTTGTQVRVLTELGEMVYAPQKVQSLCSDQSYSTESLSIDFNRGEVIFRHGLKVLGNHDLSCPMETSVYEEQILERIIFC